MNELSSLAGIGLELPSPMYLLVSLLFGLIGYLAFRRGRAAARPELTWAGVALMLYPYAVSQTWILWLVGLVMCGWLYKTWDE